MTTPRSPQVGWRAAGRAASVLAVLAIAVGGAGCWHSVLSAPTLPPGDRFVVPLIDSEAPHLHIPAHLEGQGPYTIIIDTGAGQCSINADLARRAGLKGIGGRLTTFTDIHGQEQEQDDARVRDLRLGDTLTMRDVGCALLSRVFGAPGGLRGLGLLGTNALQELRLTVDRDAGVVVVEPASKAPPLSPAPGQSHIPFHLGSGQTPKVAVKLDGQPRHFLFDTGASQSALTLAEGQKLGLPVDKSVSGVTVGTHSRFRYKGVFRPRQLQIGELVHRDQALWPTQLTSREMVGVLGQDVLKHYRVVIDYGKAVIVLSPRAAAQGGPETRAMLMRRLSRWGAQLPRCAGGAEPSFAHCLAMATVAGHEHEMFGLELRTAITRPLRVLLEPLAPSGAPLRDRHLIRMVLMPQAAGRMQIRLPRVPATSALGVKAREPFEYSGVAGWAVRDAAPYAEPCHGRVCATWQPR
jgi:predicted aspartyl protease